MGQGRLFVLALLATAWSCSGDIYPLKERRRTRAAKCFDGSLDADGVVAKDELRSLSYGNGNHPVSVAFPAWNSARVTSEITYILLSEVMGYRSHLLDTGTLISAHPVNYAAGCRDADDRTGVGCNVSKPIVHITVETWMAGYRALSKLPDNIRPTLLRTMDLPIIDTWFIHAYVRDEALKSRCRVMLDDYRAYKFTNNTDCAAAHTFFDSWQTVLQRFKEKAYVDPKTGYMIIIIYLYH
jgi:hypothetical protein